MADSNMSKTSPYPFCIDCKWIATAEQVKEAAPPLSVGCRYCFIPSPVTGKAEPILFVAPCYDRREIGGECGIEGRLFEAKD